MRNQFSEYISSLSKPFPKFPGSQQGTQQTNYFFSFFSFSGQRMVIWMPEAMLKPETAHEKSLIPRAEYMKKSGFAFHLISRSSMIYNRVH